MLQFTPSISRYSSQPGGNELVLVVVQPGRGSGLAATTGSPVELTDERAATAKAARAPRYSLLVTGTSYWHSTYTGLLTPAATDKHTPTPANPRRGHLIAPCLITTLRLLGHNGSRPNGFRILINWIKLCVN